MDDQYRKFIEDVADKCISDMSETDKAYIADHPRAIDYHMGYCMYIRNHYIHNNEDYQRNFGDVHPDDTSSSIMERIISKLTEYDPDDPLLYRLFDKDIFIRLRKEYRKIYGTDTMEIIDSFRDRFPEEESEDELLLRFIGLGILQADDYHYDREDKPADCKKIYEQKDAVVNQIIYEIAKKVWREDKIRETAAQYGINVKDLDDKIRFVENVLLEDSRYIPMTYTLLFFSDLLDESLYRYYSEELINEIDDNPRLIENLDTSVFNDRGLAKSLFEVYPSAIRYLSIYQDDEEMVKWVIEHDGSAIEHVDPKFANDRTWAKLAIENSRNRTIMHLDCMSKYRTDKEFVYLACRMDPWNFTWVDHSFRDDRKLVASIMESPNYRQSIAYYLSDRLKDDLGIALLEAKSKEPDMECFSEHIRDNDPVAESLISNLGKDSWRLYYMSDRIKKKYGLFEDED